MLINSIKNSVDPPIIFGLRKRCSYAVLGNINVCSTFITDIVFKFVTINNFFIRNFGIVYKLSGFFEIYIVISACYVMIIVIKSINVYFSWWYVYFTIEI